MQERDMPDFYKSTEDPQEPSQPVCSALPVQPAGNVQAPPDSVLVEALPGDQQNLSILNGHQIFFEPVTSDPDQQAKTLHARNGTFQKEEHNGEVKSDVADDSTSTTLTWHVFSHEIHVKTGFPGTGSWPQENGHHGKLSFDSLELEKVTLILPVEEGQAVAQPATDEQFEVMRYAEWLTADAKRNNNSSYQEESKKYAEDALKTITVNGQEFRTFAPFRHALSAYKTLTRRQAVVLSLIMLGCGLGLLFYGIKLVIVIIAMITLLYLSSLLLDFLISM